MTCDTELLSWVQIPIGRAVCFNVCAQPPRPKVPYLSFVN